MSLSRKLFFGFGAVILIVVALGMIAHLLFRQIGSNMSALSTRSLPVVKLASDLQRTVLEAVAEERDYLLDQKSEKHTSINEKLKSLSSLLQELDGAAKQHGDSDLAARGDQARKALDEHGVLYNRTVGALDSNKKQELVMDDKGAVVDEELEVFMGEKKTEYLEAKDALALLNSIYALILDVRLREKSYLLDPDKQHLNAMERNAQEALRQCDELDKLHRGETEKKQIGLVKASVEEHVNAFRSYVAEYETDPQGSALPERIEGLNRSGDRATQITEDYILVKQGAVEQVAQAVFIVRDLNNQALKARINEKAFVITKELKYWELLNQHIQSLSELYEKLRKVSGSTKDRERIDRAAQATTDYLVAANSWKKTDTEVRQDILPKMYQNGNLVITAATDIESDAWEKSEKASNQSQSVVGKSGLVISAALGAGILVGLILAWAISRSITRPINRIIEGLSSSAGQVASASNQISSASHQLADGSSEQAAAIEETSASLEEMASMTKQNAEAASQCKSVMREAEQVFQVVDGHMGNMVEAIENISKSSEETQKIVKAIDEIAFQTNLLALNAAVEAARAGEAGAGFAVVADEVRNLAMRAAEAAKTTSDLIEKTVKSVREGSEITRLTQDGFKRNVEIAHRVAGLIDEIAAATNEQSQGIDQVNRAVLDMEKVTQQNSSNAEESASASTEMSAQAEQMKDFVAGLVSLVGGNGSGRRKGRFLPAPDKRQTQDLLSAQMLGKAQIQAGNGNGKKKGVGAEPPARRDGAREIGPEELVLMEDGDLKDF